VLVSARLAPSCAMEGKFTSVHDALYQKPSTHPLLSTGLNPHIQKFMERKAPKPIAIRTANHVREDVSIVHYPKPELKDTVILCARLALALGRDPLLAVSQLLTRLPFALRPQEKHEHAYGNQGRQTACPYREEEDLGAGQVGYHVRPREFVRKIILLGVRAHVNSRCMHVAESRNGWPLGPGLILTRAAPPELHDGAVGVTGPPRPVMRQQAGLTDYISRLGNSEAVRLQSTPVSR